MASTHQLSARSEETIDALFKRANDNFDVDQIEESERLSHHLLGQPDLRDYQKAGCHRILSYGYTDFLYHGEQAIKLYEKLSAIHSESSYSSEELKAQKYLLGCVKQSLADGIEYVEDEDGYIAVSKHGSVTKTFAAIHRSSYSELPSQIYVGSPYVSYNLHLSAFGGNHHQRLQGGDEEARDNADTDEEEEFNDSADTGEEEEDEDSADTGEEEEDEDSPTAT